MKKWKKLGMVVFCSIVLVGCSNSDKSGEESSTSNTKTSQTAVESSTAESDKSEKTTDSAVSIDIFSTGEYIVGTDIQPGAYYAVLTDIEYAEDDSDNSAYTSIYILDSDDTPILSKMFEKLNSKHRFILEDGQKIVFDDNYSPKSWTMKLLNESDFKEYNNSDNTVTESQEEASDKTKQSAEALDDFSEQLKELSSLYDDLIVKMENFSTNPETYTLENFTTVQSEMNTALLKLSKITDSTSNGNSLSNESGLELYTTVMEKQTKLMIAASELPSKFAE